MGLTLTRAQQSDKPFLFELRKLTMFEPLANAGIKMSNSQHMQRVSDFFEDCYIIQLGKKDIGMIKYKDLSWCYEIIQFQIHPNYQGQGYGKSILNQIKEKAHSETKHISLKVLKGNPAFSLYEKNGFKLMKEDDQEYQMEWNHLTGIQISTSESSFIGPKNFAP